MFIVCSNPCNACNKLFLCISLPLFCTSTTRNLQKLPSYTFYIWRKIEYVFSFTFFFTAAHFYLALVAASIHHFLTAAKKNFHVLLTKKSPLFFSRSKSLSPFFLLRFTGLSPTFYFSLSFSCSIFQITCGLSLLL